MHSFTGAPDGLFPYGGLVLDSGHNLYGATEFGGSVTYGSGIVFKLDKSGKETLLYTFGVADGAPTASVVLDSLGNVYGTTENSGGSCFEGCGTVFKLDQTGTLTFLHLFTGPPDGEYQRHPCFWMRRASFTARLPPVELREMEQYLD
ncbi:MAG TPA: choice-of-anchor tandem repeat GloVer-containing protein [Terriglobia bacterium]|nr:choice-of-anchor tandem repeat GloVer-containing protein [Terriglobia bacterium]